MTGYTEEFAKIWGGGTRLGKGRKKGRQRRKTTAQSRLHSQGSRGCHSCHRKTMVLCFESPLQLSLDTGCGAGSAATASGNRSPKGAVDTRKILHAMCFSALLAPSDWQSQRSDIHSLPRKGASRKGSKNKRHTFQHHMERLATKSEIRCWQQKINICLIHTLYQV